MNLKKRFALRSLSLTGSSHQQVGSRSQDNLVTEVQPDFLLFGVSDGVGSSKTSEAGSWVLCQALRRIVLPEKARWVQQAQAASPETLAQDFAARINEQLVPEMEAAKAFFGGDQAALNTLTATLLSGYITEHAWGICGVGDGIVGVNSEVREIFNSENMPNAPVYAISQADPTGSWDGKLQPLCWGLTSELDCLLIGSDGVQSLFPMMLPGSEPESRNDPKWIEKLIARSLARAANGSLPHDDATLVGVWRKQM